MLEMERTATFNYYCHRESLSAVISTLAVLGAQVIEVSPAAFMPKKALPLSEKEVTTDYRVQYQSSSTLGDSLDIATEEARRSREEAHAAPLER